MRTRSESFKPGGLVEELLYGSVEVRRAEESAELRRRLGEAEPSAALLESKRDAPATVAAVSATRTRPSGADAADASTGTR